jgi:glutaredoxin
MKNIIIGIIAIAAACFCNQNLLAGTTPSSNDATPSLSKNTLVVEVYTMPGCVWCEKTRKFLTNNKIEFIEYDIVSSANNRKRFDKLESRGVPLIIIGDNRILGFNEETLRKTFIDLD